VTGDGIPPEVADFIAKYIGSIVQLESLLLLAGNPGRRWAADDVARELRIDRGWANAQLNVLRGQSLVVCDDGSIQLFHYAPPDQRMRDTVAALARAYAERRVTVTSLIFAKPADALRAFSDAFRFRPDKGGHGG
jgi:hypothetical protein